MAANGRKIAYYESWNTRTRLCNKIRPADINTKGLTHLYFAFASIDPKTWQVVPANPADEELYREFTALKSKGLKTWIAIGGFEFSDPDTPTHTTWSDMVSRPERRAAFIMSVLVFMGKYGFQGADIDWEYPTSVQRGGREEDTENLVSLMKEMKGVFGTQFGLSIVLAPDYWYLRGFDPMAMEPYVDWFGFMAYDLHGPWDVNVAALGAPKVRPHTDIREIKKGLLPMAFAGVNPYKINFGLSYYGRGYTLEDSSCNRMDCLFSGPSKPSSCVNYEGVMSNREIQQLIVEKSLKPTLVAEAMVKQVTWEDQWIGYDDEETIAMKTAVANDYCMGGTMVRV
jgi:chitinase